MSDPELETPAAQNPAPAPAPTSASPWKDLFSQANLTTGLAVFAVVLAGAPYVVPQVQSFLVERGMLNRPAMLETASIKLQAQKAESASQALAAGIKSRHDSLFNDKSDPILGNPNAPIKIVEFLDYNCGYCRAATPALKTFLERNPDVAIIVKEYPVINENSHPLAAIALAAAKTGHYEEVHYALMTEKLTSSAQVDRIMALTGLAPKDVAAMANSAEIQTHIDRVVQLGRDIGIDGTPMFIIGDKAISGWQPNEIEKAVAAARAKKP